MIREGDRVLIGLSGGKDSLTLLHLLRAIQKKSRVKFEIAAATVDPLTPAFNPTPLKAYMVELGVPYTILGDPIFERAKQGGELLGTSICAFCARMKRGLLYAHCRKAGHNVLALGQHLDDLAESFFMSAFHNAQLRTMSACYVEAAGNVRVVRPLAYARESELRAFADRAALPVINENCPACFEVREARCGSLCARAVRASVRACARVRACEACVCVCVFVCDRTDRRDARHHRCRPRVLPPLPQAPTERHRLKKMLQREESVHKDIFNNLRRAMLPLMDAATAKGLHQQQRDLDTKGQHGGEGEEGMGAVVRVAGYRSFRKRHKGSKGKGHKVCTPEAQRQWAIDNGFAPPPSAVAQVAGAGLAGESSHNTDSAAAATAAKSALSSTGPGSAWCHGR